MRALNQIIFDNLGKKYNNKIIFENISFNIKKGEVIKIDGSNGCGKSTLLRCISGISKLDKGKIYIKTDKGKTVINPDSSFYKSTVSLCSQQMTLKNEKYPIEAIYGYIKYFRREIKKDEIFHYFELFNISLDDQKRKIYQLSGGTQRKLELIKTLLVNSDFLLFDEPLAGIDKKNKEIVLKKIERLKSEGKGIIIIEHGDYFESIIDKKYILENKKLWEVSKMEEIISIEIENAKDIDVNEIKLIDGVLDAQIEEVEEENKDFDKLKDKLGNLDLSNAITIKLDSSNIDKDNDYSTILEKAGIDPKKVKSMEVLNLKNTIQKKFLLKLKILKDKRKKILLELMDYLDRKSVIYKNISL
ncbi:MAG: ATP-binding cassette domain-containing protein [Spirochaetes bacterium]|nr:ATP-binding cassette domain-containing protein [Spirochaetota bacterium]